MSKTKYEEKLANPDDWQIRIDKERRKIRFEDGVSIRSLGDIIYFLIFQRYTTYFKLGTQHCRYGALRSIDDAYRLCKYYDISCTLKQVKEAIELFQKSSYGIRSGVFNFLAHYSFCYVVRKRVYSNIYSKTTKEEVNQILDKHSMNIYIKEDETIQVN